jgi:hypothetical protein
MKRIILSLIILLIALPLIALSTAEAQDLQTELDNCLVEISAKITAKSLGELKGLLSSITPDAQYAGIELQLILCYAFEAIDTTARDAVQVAVKPILDERDAWRNATFIAVGVGIIAGILIRGVFK